MRQQNIFLPLVVADLSRAGPIIDRIIPFLDRRFDLLYIGVQVPGEARQELLKPWVGGRLKAFYDGFGDRVFVEISHLSILIRSEEHTYEFQSLLRTLYAVFCYTKK